MYLSFTNLNELMCIYLFIYYSFICILLIILINSFIELCIMFYLLLVIHF